MKPLIICLSFFCLSPVSSMAEDPVMLGLRGALNVFAPVPTETSQAVQTKAAEMLARYVKPLNGSLLAQRESFGNRVWMEMKGLRLTRVTAKTMSQADHANGTLECYMVSVNCEMYRTYDTAAAKWSIWHNGPNPFMPPLIYVERKTAGQWAARLPESTNLIAQRAIGDPHLIPHGTPPPQNPVLTQASAPQPAPSIKTQIPPADGKPVDTTEKHPVSWTGIVVLLVIISAVSAFLNEIRPKKGSGKRRKSRRSAKNTPPPFPFQASSPQPPPLPSSVSGQNANPIDLMRPKENLMTPAEQAFFAVLQPIVSPSCIVSSKVRLADLFDVRQERGQQAAFNKICSKHIDFVLTEPGSSRILCGIELDDSSHNRPDRMERDNFVNELFAAHGMPLLRVPFTWTYNVPGLRTELLKAGVPIANAA